MTTITRNDKSDKQVRLITQRLEQDFQFFARHALTIKTKEGQFNKFHLNRAQQYLHQQVEKQKRETGRVRALVLKGRQQGCSTYISARFYHRTTRVKGTSSFILSHEAETTKKLFKMVERFNDSCPEPLRPQAKIANRREYQFAGIQSDYCVGTAGNKDVGRGGTLQLFHGSEVAFWDNTDDIQTGVMQSVPDAPNTEVFLESTANGMGNMFYDMCMEAVQGRGDYICVFIPWFWQDEYTRPTPPDDNPLLSPEEQEYKETYNLTDGQMYFRRAKIIQFKNPWKFRQEYPANIHEAFQTSGDSLLNAERIMKARTSTLTDNTAPRILGVDPGRNKDRTVFVMRQGREVLSGYKTYKFEGEDEAQMQIAGLIIQAIKTHQLDRVFIDVGQGNGVYDRCCELGYRDTITRVDFGMNADEPAVYLNKRAEMAGRFKDWLHGEEGPVSIPDCDVFHKDIGSIPDFDTTSSGRLQLPAKSKIKRELKRSPDIFDATILTFAFPVRSKASLNHHRIVSVQEGKSPLKTLQRVRPPSRMKMKMKHKHTRRL